MKGHPDVILEQLRQIVWGSVNSFTDLYIIQLLIVMSLICFIYFHSARLHWQNAGAISMIPFYNTKMPLSLLMSHIICPKQLFILFIYSLFPFILYNIN